MTWATPEQVIARWADAPDLDDELLSDMLQAAHEVCVEYAPALVAGAPLPQRYIEAEARQVRAIYTAWQRDGDVLGFGDGFAVRVRPLDEDVKALLRPRRGKPRVR
jgi:hypothetical protein